MLQPTCDRRYQGLPRYAVSHFDQGALDSGPPCLYLGILLHLDNDVIISESLERSTLTEYAGAYAPPL